VDSKIPQKPIRVKWVWWSPRFRQSLFSSAKTLMGVSRIKGDFVGGFVPIGGKDGHIVPRAGFSAGLGQKCTRSIAATNRTKINAID